MDMIQIFPKKIESLSEEFVILASCGSKYSCCLTNNNRLFEWGKGSYKKAENVKTLLKYIVPQSLPVVTNR